MRKDIHESGSSGTKVDLLTTGTAGNAAPKDDGGISELSFELFLMERTLDKAAIIVSEQIPLLRRRREEIAKGRPYASRELDKTRPISPRQSVDTYRCTIIKTVSRDMGELADLGNRLSLLGSPAAPDKAKLGSLGDDISAFELRQVKSEMALRNELVRLRGQLEEIVSSTKPS
jgi:hypothetical protein